ncbi:unnamed protein product [Caenorhabditis bovis]|uniref:TBC1 domain family member 13 n=1 Tax=Caenorhabditis bovis TaxID=2654633 RepID=A0A8S1EFT3_9PELO|nr:unnamed protein product [Caenorhabditis bovis]
MTSRYMERMAKIEQVLLIDNKKIDIDELRNGCSYGVPEQLRPLVWRLLLNYLPLERHKWPSYLKEQRATYDQLIEQIIVEPGKEALNKSINDHPLSDNPASDWQAFFQDNKVLTQIDKDVRRLYPEIQFFQLQSKFPHKYGVNYPLSKRVSGQELDSQEYGINRDGIISCVKENIRVADNSDEKSGSAEFHWHIVERILFIYAKLNPGVQYVQGMNELVAPIYYVLATDSDEEWAAFAEADTFFCFQQLMSEVKDNFIKTLDDSVCGIESSMSNFHNLIMHFDNELYNHLIGRLDIKPQFYAFRWLSLLLSQEFPLPDVITLWDALFADSKRFTLLPYVCLAMMELQRNELLNGDFSLCVRTLQNYPVIDIANLVAFAQDIRDGKAQKPVKEIQRKMQWLVILMLICCSRILCSDFGPLSTSFMKSMYRLKNYDNLIRHILTYGYTGSFGGAESETPKILNTPIVFIHGNSDSALKHGTDIYQSGWNQVLEFFLENGYTMSELYGMTYGDRNISNSYTRHFDCQLIRFHREFIENVLIYTKSVKVNIIAHSMGVSIARKAIQGGTFFDDDGKECDIGDSLSHRVGVLIGLAAANHGMCPCQFAHAFPACGFKTGFYPGNCGDYKCDSDIHNLKGVCNVNEYSPFLSNVNNFPKKEADYIASFWSDDDEVLGKNNMVFGRKTSLIPRSDMQKVYIGLTHNEVKMTAPDQLKVMKQYESRQLLRYFNLL